MSRPNWEEMFMTHAILAATRSSCLVRQVGAVLVKDKRIIASGYNGAPPGVETCLDTGVCFYQNLAYQDSLKGLGAYEVLKEQRKDFCSAIHAEKNAVGQCTVHGVSPVGSTLYSTNFPCPGCVRDAIIPSRIKEVVLWKGYLVNHLLTMDEYTVSQQWLAQANIPVRKLVLTEKRLKEISAAMLLVGRRTNYQFQQTEPTQT